MSAMNPIRPIPVFLLLSASAFGQDSWVGREFMDRVNAKVMNENLEIPLSQLSWPLVVAEVKGDWLNVGPGFIKKSDVVAIEDAVAYYTQYLASDPQSSWAYNCRGIVRKAKGELDNALKDYSEAIRFDPKSAAAYSNRGVVWRLKGELDNALEDSSEAIRLNPELSVAYSNRGTIWQVKSELDNALKDYSEAIRLDPKRADAHYNRAIVWQVKGELDNALTDYSEAIRLDPKAVNAYNNRAWLNATCRQETIRNGKQAVADSTKACELTAWKKAEYLDTLAAAYAEAGDFASAVKWQQKAIDLDANNAGFVKVAKEHLELYRSGKPYRE